MTEGTISFTGKFEHICSLDKVNFTCSITPKSVLLECMSCHKKILYRVSIE